MSAALAWGFVGRRVRSHYRKWGLTELDGRGLEGAGSGCGGVVESPVRKPRSRASRKREGEAAS